MSWDGGPRGWVPPGEAKAAEEAAVKFERERAAADTRTQAIADAIAFGFDRVAMAIVAAAGDDAAHRFDRMNCGDLDCGLPGPMPGDPGTAYDPDLDDLLGDDVDDYDPDDDPDDDPLG